MKFENTRAFNFEGAFRGLRNPLESWDKSDSWFGLVHLYNDDPLTDVCDAWIEHENVGRRERGVEEYSHEMKNYNEYYDILEKYEHWLVDEGILNADKYDDVYDVAFIGPNDLALAQKLILAGNEHAKFMRQIFVSVDITAPIYFFKEFDTYKIGTTANSTSTMHKLTSEPITPDKFEWDVNFGKYQDSVMDICEMLRQKYVETKDKCYWRALVQILPQAWLQTRTVTMSYTNLRNIYFQRRSHKLIEWHKFCEWIKSLPYAEELITIE